MQDYGGFGHGELKLDDGSSAKAGKARKSKACQTKGQMDRLTDKATSILK